MPKLALSMLLAATCCGSGFFRALCAEDEVDATARKAAGERANEVARRFVRGLNGKDVEAIMKVSGLPWLDVFDEQLVKDRGELKRFWEEKFRDRGPSRIPDERIEARPFTEFRMWTKSFGDAELDEALRKKHEAVVSEFGKVLDPSDWVVMVSGKDDRENRVLLVRERQGQAKVVGGPFANGYVMHENRIPRQALRLLDKAARFELLSLDPKLYDPKPADDFHDWKVLGKTLISEGADRKKLVRALKRGVEEHLGVFAGCFNPRHGIRLTHEGKSVDFVVCFECQMVMLYLGDGTEDSFSTTGLPQSVFDEALRKAGVPLAEKAKK